MRSPLTRTATALAVVGLLVFAGATLAEAAPPGRLASAQATGPLLLDEDFTGTAAIAEFSGYGTACLTGAPVGGPLSPGAHPLSGCPAQGAPPAGFAGLFPLSPPLGSAPNGYLRLTDALPDQSGAVLFDTPLQATDGVEITFEQWQYGGYSTIAQFPGQTADGISFFLVDATAVLDAPGAFGGSLGYAKKLPDDNATNTIVPGVAGGYLGFGFDVLGNFYGDWEQRGRGCGPGQLSPAGNQFQVPAPGANMVTVRGPAGADRTLGYCFLTATATGPRASTLPGTLHGPTVGPIATDPAAAVTALEPSRRTVTMLLEPEPVHTITVFIDFHDGNGSQQVLSMQAPEPVPAAVKFGFAASTGAFTDVHLIRTLRMQALDPPPEIKLDKLVTSTEGLGVGDAVDFGFTVTNTGGGAVTDIVVDDPRIADVSCPQTTLAEGETMNCTGRYTLTQADVARGSLLNTAIAVGVGRGGTLDSDPADATLDLAQLAPTGIDPAVLGAVGLAGILLLLYGTAALLARRRSPG